MVGKNSEVFEIQLNKEFGPTNILKVETFKVIIAGGRDFQDAVKLANCCDKLLANKVSIEVVSGTARGTDKLGEDYADSRGYLIKRFPADWEDISAEGAVVKHRKDGTPYNVLAGHTRNQRMADYADALIAFWDGKSNGTENMIKTARKMGLEVRVIKY